MIPIIRYYVNANNFQRGTDYFKNIIDSTKVFISHELHYLHRHFSLLPATRYFKNLADKITSCAMRNIPTETPIATQEANLPTELSVKLHAIADGRFDEVPDEGDDEDENPLNERSRLNEIENRSNGATVLDFNAMDQNLSQAVFLTQPSLFSYLPEAFQAIVTNLAPYFTQARDRQLEIEKIAVEGEINYASAKQKMSEKAAELSATIAALPEGQTINIFAPVSYGKNSLLHMAVTQLGKYLDPDKPELNIDSLKRIVVEKIHEQLSQFNIGQRYGEVLEVFTNLKAKMLGENPSHLRVAVVESLSGDFATLLREKSAELNVPETLLQNLDDLPGALERKIDEVLQNVFSSLDMQLNRLNQTAQSLLPTMVQDVLAEQKLFVAQQFAYFIIQKKGEGYTITVYPSKRDPSFYLDQERGFHSPLVYENVQASQLSPEFFYRAFTYQAFLQQQGVESFTLQHLKEGLLDQSFASPIGKPGCEDRDFNDQTLEGLEYTLTREAVIAESGLSKEGFNRAFQKAAFDYKFDQFLRGWDYFHHHLNTHLTADKVETMKMRVQALADDLNRIRQAHIYSPDELLERYETLVDAAKKLHRLRMQLKKRERPLVPSLHIPPELRNKIAQICQTETAVSAVEMVRSLFVELLGEDADEALEQIVNELLPTAGEGLPAPELVPEPDTTIPFVQKLGFKNVLGKAEFDQIKIRGSEFSQRISLLTTYRIYSAICNFCNDSLVGTLLELFIKGLLVVFFPGVIVSTFLAKSFLDRAALHGRQAAISLLPKPIADGLLAFLSLYVEISGYLKKRVAMVVMRSGFRTLFNEHRQMFLRHVQQFSSKVTREGTLNYNLSNVSEAPEQIETPPETPTAAVLPETPLVIEPSIITTSPAATSQPVAHPNDTVVFEESLCKTIFDLKIFEYFTVRIPGLFGTVQKFREGGHTLALNRYSYIRLKLCELNILKAQELPSRRNTAFITKLMVLYHRLYIAAHTLAGDASCLDTFVKDMPDKIKEILPYPNPEYITSWIQGNGKHNTAELISHFQSIYGQLKFKPKSSPIWSKKEIINADRRKNEYVPQNAKTLYHYFVSKFHNDDSELRNVELNESNIDTMIEKVFLKELAYPGYDTDFSRQLNVNFLQKVGRLLVKICVNIEELHNSNQYILQERSLISELVRSNFHEELTSVKLHSSSKEIALGVGQLQTYVKDQHELGTFNPDLFILYFRVTAAAYSQAQKHFFDRKMKEGIHPPKTLWKALPAPDYRQLEMWVHSQANNLTEIQLSEAQFLLQLFHEMVPEGATPWNDETIIQSITQKGPGRPESFFSEWDAHEGDYIMLNSYTDLEIETRFGNFTKHFNFFNEKHSSDPESIYLHLAFMGEYLFLACKNQIDPLIAPSGQLFLRDAVLTEDNTIDYLESACAYIQKETARRKLETELEKTVSGSFVHDIKHRSASTFVTQLIRRMPIPKNRITTCFWDKVSQPERVIELLYELQKYLNLCERSLENEISMHALYVIVFHLVKRNPECHITLDYYLSGFEFINYIATARKSFTQIQSGSTIKQAVDLLNYFKAGLANNSGIYDGKKSSQQLAHKICQIVIYSTRFTVRHPSNLKDWDRWSQFKYENTTSLDTCTASYYYHLSLQNEMQIKYSMIPHLNLNNSSRIKLITTGNRVFSTIEKSQVVKLSPKQKQKLMLETSIPPVDEGLINIRDVFYLYTDVNLNSGARILPNDLRILREMEYLALRSYSPYQPNVQNYTEETFTQNIIDMTESRLSNSNILTQFSFVLLKSIHSFKFKRQILQPTRGMDYPPADYKNGRIDNNRFHHDTPTELRKRGDAALYRGEEFLRTLQLIRDNPQYFMEKVVPDYFLGNYLSVELLISWKPRMIELVIGEMLGLLDSRELQPRHTHFVRMLLRIGRMVITTATPHQYGYLHYIRLQIRERLIAGSLSDWAPLVESYVDEAEIFSMPLNTQLDALTDISMGYIKTIKLPDDQIGENTQDDDDLINGLASTVLNYWKPYLIEQFRCDPELIEKVMMALFRGCTEPETLQGTWRGVYPVFTNGTLTVNLEMLVKDEQSQRLYYYRDNYFTLSPTEECPPPSQIDEDSVFDGVDDENDEIKVDLKQSSHSLGLLTWFQPLEDIHVFAKRWEPSKISKIVFPEVLNLTFGVVEKEGHTRAYNEGTFPGYFIAEQQKRTGLIPYSQYLLLENDRGEHKLILLPLTLAQLSGAIIAKIGLNISITAGISQWIPTVSKTPPIPVVCSFDENGDLSPDTLEGIAYLFVFHYAQGNRALCREYLKELQERGKKGQISENAWTFLDMMVLPLLLSMTDEANELGCSLAALLYENDLLFFNAELIAKRAKYSRISLWLMAQKSYVGLKEGKRRLPINEFSEMSLLKGLSVESRVLVGEHIPASAKGLLKKIGVKVDIMSFLEGMMLHPMLSKRLAKLRKKHLDSNQAALQYMIVALLTEQTPKVSQAAAATSQENTESQAGSGFLMNTLDIARSVRKYTVDPANVELKRTLLKAFVDFDFNADFDAAPVHFADISPEDIQRYFVIYLCMLLDFTEFKDGDEVAHERFKAKGVEFRRNLLLMKGNYKNEIKPLIELLTFASQYEHIFSNFSFIPRPLSEITNTLPPPIPFLEQLKDLVKDCKDKKIENLSDEMSEILQRFLQVFKRLSIQGTAANVLTSRGVVQTAKSIVNEAAKFSIPYFKYFFAIKKAIDTVYAIPAWVDWGKKQLNRLKKLSKAPSPTDQNGDAPAAPIPSEWVQDLKTRDEAVDAIFDYLLEKHFAVTYPPQEHDEREIQPLTLSDESSAGAAFEELCQSHIDFHNRPVEQRPAIAFTGNLETLKAEVEEIRRTTVKRIKAERDKIVSFVNAAGRNTLKNPVTFEGYFKEHVDISFDEIFSAILRGDEAELMEKANLSIEWMNQLKLLLQLHLIACSRWDCLFQEYDKAIKNGSLESLGSALLVRRSYDFANKDPRILLGFLTFEARTGKVLWKKQAELFEKILTNSHYRQVLELIMGSGKTAFGMPFINFIASNKKQFVINIWPKPTAATNIEMNSRQIHRVFGQSSWAFTFERNSAISVNTLESFYLTLQRSMQYSEPLNMTKEDLQSLQLNFIILLNSAESDIKNNKPLSQEDYRRIDLYGKIFSFMRAHGLGNIDEAHENFAQNRERNFPIGKKKQISKKYTRIMERVFDWLMAIDIPELIPFKTPKAVLHKIEREFFLQNISPRLYENACVFFKIAPHQRDLFLQYLHGDIAEPDFIANRADYEEISLARGMLRTLLPFAFSSIPHVDFTISKNEIDEFARPAEANDKPDESSIIQMPYETFVKTCIYYLKRRLTPTQVKNYIVYLRNKAKANGTKAEIAIEATSPAKFFNVVTEGANLFDERVDTDPAIIQKLIDNDSFNLSYIRKLIANKIDYYGEKCSSNSHSFASLLAKIKSCTGSRDNHETYPEGIQLLFDPGTQGESLAIIREKCGTEPIPILKADTALGLLEETLTKFFQPGSDYYAIIERGALYRGLSNATIAKKMVSFCEIYRPDIKGVVFWDDHNNEMIWETNASKPTLLKNSRLSPHEYLISFDESHTYATDKLLPPGAKAVVTFGEHTRLEGGFQAIWRVRGLNDGQSFTFTTSESVRKIINKKIVFADDVVEFFVKNTEPYRENENYENAPKRMFNVVHTEIFGKIITAADPYKMIEIFSRNKTIFVEKIEDRPSALFGGCLKKGSPRQALTIYRKTLDKHIESPLFNAIEKDGMIERINNSMAGTYPPVVDIRENGGIDRIGLGQQVQIQQDSETNIENEAQMENEEIVRNEQQQQNAIHISAHDLERWYWEKDLNFFKLQNWLMLSTETHVPIHRVRDLCDGPLSLFADLIPQTLLATNNFAPIRNKQGLNTLFAPFISDQQPAYQVLVIQQQTHKTVLLIDQKEANIIRKRLPKQCARPGESDKKIALYDMGFDRIVASSAGYDLRNKLHRDPDFNRMTAFVKFLSGEVRYRDEEIEELRRCFRGIDPKRIKSAFKQIIVAQEGEAWSKKYYGSKLHTMILELSSPK